MRARRYSGYCRGGAVRKPRSGAPAQMLLMVGRGEKLGRRFKCVTCHFNDGNIPMGMEKAKFI